MSGKEVTTIMVLEVDLQCSKCYEKVKKVLCKFPQIQDQIYDEKQNKVTIKVISCCPEKIRDKICCKGDGVIKRIEIKSPEKIKDNGKKKEDDDKNGKTNNKKEKEDDNKTDKTKDKKEKDVPDLDVVAHPYPYGVCCPECYMGHGGGPCYRGGPPLRIWYDGYYGRPVCDSWGCGCGCSRQYYIGRSDCLCEENPSACTIM